MQDWLQVISLQKHLDAFCINFAALQTALIIESKTEAYTYILCEVKCKEKYMFRASDSVYFHFMIMSNKVLLSTESFRMNFHM